MDLIGTAETEFVDELSEQVMEFNEHSTDCVCLLEKDSSIINNFVCIGFFGDLFDEIRLAEELDQYYLSESVSSDDKDDADSSGTV